MSDSPAFQRPTVDWKAHITTVRDHIAAIGNTIDYTQVRYGESFLGNGAEVEMAHPTVLIGPINGPVGQAACIAFANPQRGHTPMMALHQPNLRAGILTVVVNEVSIAGVAMAVHVGGALQRAAADAVLHCMQAGILPKDPSKARALAIVFQGFVHWEAKDTEKIYWWNYVAMVECIVRAFSWSPSYEEIVKLRAKHPYCDIETAEFPKDVEALSFGSAA